MRYSTLALVVLAACGGGSTAADTSEPDDLSVGRKKVRPINVTTDVRVTRVGSAVRLDVEAIARDAPQGAAFETPDRWTISARQGGRRLQRLVNGSVAVERRQAEVETQWDTVVRFNLVYQVDEAGGELALELRPPGGGKAYARRFAVAEIPEGLPEEGSGVEAAAAVDAEIAAEREAEAKAKAEEEARLAAEEEARLKAERKRKKKRKKRD